MEVRGHKVELEQRSWAAGKVWLSLGDDALWGRQERLGVTPHGPVFSPRANLRPFLLKNWQCGVYLSGGQPGVGLSPRGLSRLCSSPGSATSQLCGLGEGT